MNDAHSVWLFEFYLESEEGTPVDRHKAEELLDLILSWSESERLQIGGGYKKPEDSDES